MQDGPRLSWNDAARELKVVTETVSIPRGKSRDHDHCDFPGNRGRTCQHHLSRNSVKKTQSFRPPLPLRRGAAPESCEETSPKKTNIYSNRFFCTTAVRTLDENCARTLFPFFVGKHKMYLDHNWGGGCSFVTACC